MAKPFRDALLEHLAREGWKMAYVADEAGVSYEQLKKLKQGHSQSTNVDDAVKIAHAFGMSLDEFIGDTTVEDRLQAFALWRDLAEEEREILLAAARGRRALAQSAD